MIHYNCKQLRNLNIPLSMKINVNTMIEYFKISVCICGSEYTYILLAHRNSSFKNRLIDTYCPGF